MNEWIASNIVTDSLFNKILRVINSNNRGVSDW